MMASVVEDQINKELRSISSKVIHGEELTRNEVLVLVFNSSPLWGGHRILEREIIFEDENVIDHFFEINGVNGVWSIRTKGNLLTGEQCEPQVAKVRVSFTSNYSHR